MNQFRRTVMGVCVGRFEKPVLQAGVVLLPCLKSPCRCPALVSISAGSILGGLLALPIRIGVCKLAPCLQWWGGGMRLDEFIDLSPVSVLEAAVEEYEAAGAWSISGWSVSADRLDARMRSILHESAPLMEQLQAAFAELGLDGDDEVGA